MDIASGEAVRSGVHEDGAPLPLEQLRPEQIEQCRESLQMTLLAAMGMEPNRSTALDGFYHAFEDE